MLDIKNTYFNERDVEHPGVIDFVKKYPKANSLLDVGAHYSSATYGSELKNIMKNKQLDGIDILEPCSREEQDLFNKFIVGNILDLSLETYDLISCVSTIEHCGISTYKVDIPQVEQLNVFSKMCELSNIALFLTFPFGQKAFVEGQFSNITSGLLDKFEDLSQKHMMSGSYKFYYNKNPAFREKWIEVSRDFASNQSFDPKKGCQTLCLATYAKQ